MKRERKFKNLDKHIFGNSPECDEFIDLLNNENAITGKEQHKIISDITKISILYKDVCTSNVKNYHRIMLALNDDIIEEILQKKYRIRFRTAYIRVVKYIFNRNLNKRNEEENERRLSEI